MVWTPFFFTSSNKLNPSLHPSCYGSCGIVDRIFWKEVKNKKTYLAIGVGIPSDASFLLVSGLVRPLYKNNTDKYLLENLNPQAPLYSLDQKSYSSQFYTQGRVQAIDQNQLVQLIQQRATGYIRITHKRWKTLPKELKNKSQRNGSASKDSRVRVFLLKGCK